MTDVGAAAPCVRAPFDHAQGGPSAAGDGSFPVRQCQTPLGWAAFAVR